MLRRKLLQFDGHRESERMRWTQKKDEKSDSQLWIVSFIDNNKQTDTQNSHKPLLCLMPQPIHQNWIVWIALSSLIEIIPGKWIDCSAIVGRENATNIIITCCHNVVSSNIWQYSHDKTEWIRLRYGNAVRWNACDKPSKYWNSIGKTLEHFPSWSIYTLTNNIYLLHYLRECLVGLVYVCVWQNNKCNSFVIRLPFVQLS